MSQHLKLSQITTLTQEPAKPSLLDEVISRSKPAEKGVLRSVKPNVRFLHGHPGAAPFVVITKGEVRYYADVIIVGRSWMACSVHFGCGGGGGSVWLETEAALHVK